ncbi:MAG: T9SS type A sorting domain-containing protein [Bacteroidota bacterium]
MRNVYFLMVLCILSLGARAQVTQAFRYATAPTGTFITGTSTNATRTDGALIVSGAGLPSRGYAVFDVSTIPTSATITGVLVGVTVYSVALGMGSNCSTYVYPGDLSTLTTAAALYPAMVTPASTLINTNTYGMFGSAIPNNITLNSNAAGIAAVQTVVGAGTGRISITFQCTSNRLYNIIGETGPAATTGNHAPFIRITYTCAGVTGVSATAAPSPLCEGATLSLTGNATGAISYSWSGPGSFLAATQNATATAVSSGTYTFTAFNSSGCGTQAPANVTVDPPPPSTVTPSGSTALCSGDVVTLDAPTGAGAYQWFKDGVAISGETSAAYVASTDGNFTVRVTSAAGCVATSTGTPVVVLATPALTPSGAVNLCTGGTSLLTVNTGGVTSGITYQWQKDGTDIPGATDATYLATASGNYRSVVGVTSGSGSCTATSSATNVIINALPNPVVNYNGISVSTATGFATYQWFLNMVAITGATSSSYVPTANGSYRVRVTSTGGCTNYSSPLTVGTVGVAQVQQADINIYPNPASTVVNIVSNVPVNAVISSVDGRSLISRKNVSAIDISSLSKGVYLVTLYSEAGERIAVKKLVKE